MPKLIMCMGLPGSGKSTWAADQPSPVVVVNKDAIRRELEASGVWVWSPTNEETVLQIRDSRIRIALTAGRDVISDDTNFARKHRVRLEALARNHGAEFVVREFDTPLAECIRRDSLRDGTAKVGEKVILDMATTYLGYKAQPPVFQPYRPNPDAMPAIICDLDGTLCLMGDRSPFDASTCDQDKVNVPVRKVIEAFYRFLHYQIIYLSGREDKYRPQTMEFFRRHGIPPGPLHMRQTGDFRKDWIIKGELFDAQVREKYRVDLVLDDRNQVVDFWRGLGLNCWQVARGDF